MYKTSNSRGDIDLHTTATEPVHLKSVDEVMQTLESGRSVHFNAMTFLCRGGREHTFSTFGGHIQSKS